MLRGARLRSNKVAILCVDSDVIALQFRKLILERNGYVVTGAISARQALDFFRTKHFDLVVSTYHLGDDTAIFMLSKMRRSKPDTPAVLVSNSMSSPDPIGSELLISATDGPAALVAKAKEALTQSDPASSRASLDAALQASAQMAVILESLTKELNGAGVDSASLPSSIAVPFRRVKEMLRPVVFLPTAAAIATIIVLVVLGRPVHTRNASSIRASNTVLSSPVANTASPTGNAATDSDATDSEKIQPENLPARPGSTTAREGPLRPVAKTGRNALSESMAPAKVQPIPTTAATSLPPPLAPPALSTVASSGVQPVLAIAASRPSPTLRVSSPPEFVLGQTLKAHSGWVTAVRFSADGERLLSGSWDQTVKMWEVSTGQEVRTIAQHIKGVQALATSRDGRLIAAESSSDTVRVWDTAVQGAPRQLNASSGTNLMWSRGWVYSIAFSPNGRWLASGVGGKSVRIWDVATGRAVRDLAAGKRAVVYIAFSPDSRWLVSGADDKTIRIWDVKTGEVVQTFTGHADVVYAASFSPDGRTLASASKDQTVKIWDVSTGRVLHTMKGHHSFVTSLAFSPHGNWLVSGSWDNDVKVWDVKSGRVVQTLSGNTHPVYSVAIAASGEWIASGSEDGTIKLWHRLEQ